MVLLAAFSLWSGNTQYMSMFSLPDDSLMMSNVLHARNARHHNWCYHKCRHVSLGIQRYRSLSSFWEKTEVTHLNSVEQHITAAIKYSVDFNWINCTGLVHHQWSWMVLQLVLHEFPFLGGVIRNDITSPEEKRLPGVAWFYGWHVLQTCCFFFFFTRVIFDELQIFPRTPHSITSQKTVVVFIYI
jgi:hypothetical protein